jgi:hypothetical protein
MNVSGEINEQKTAPVILETITITQDNEQRDLTLYSNGILLDDEQPIHCEGAPVLLNESQRELLQVFFAVPNTPLSIPDLQAHGYHFHLNDRMCRKQLKADLRGLSRLAELADHLYIQGDDAQASYAFFTQRLTPVSAAEVTVDAAQPEGTFPFTELVVIEPVTEPDGTEAPPAAVPQPASSHQAVRTAYTYLQKTEILEEIDTFSDIELIAARELMTIAKDTQESLAAIIARVKDNLPNHTAEDETIDIAIRNTVLRLMSLNSKPSPKLIPSLFKLKPRLTEEEQQLAQANKLDRSKLPNDRFDVTRIAMPQNPDSLRYYLEK